VSPVKYELGFYISEDGILHSHRREKSQILHDVFLFYSSTIKMEASSPEMPIDFRWNVGLYMPE
jgi:hypothetical protein